MTRQSATPRRRDPAARTQEILTAASAILTEEGSTELTHRAVAQRADLALGTVTRYFPAIDSLRGKALVRLSDGIDAELDELEPILLRIDTHPNLVAHAIHGYLSDQDQVRADLALTVAGAYEPELRHLSLRWTNRLTEILARRIGRRRALSLTMFFDGVAINSALHDYPVDLQLIIDTTHAVLNMTDEKQSPDSGGGIPHER